MVGNSLLLAGVDVDRLQQLTATSLRIYPIFLEATTYYDWLYGLRRLFREGARPQVVVVGLPVSSFLGNGVRHEYGPLMLFDAREVLDASSDSGLDRTATSNLLLEHWSTFWDARSILRAQILRHMIPHFEDLFMLARGKPTIPQGAEFDRIASSRLRRLREICEAHGAKLILVIPPTPRQTVLPAKWPPLQEMSELKHWCRLIPLFSPQGITSQMKLISIPKARRSSHQH